MPALCDRALEPGGGDRIFAAHVEVGHLAAGREAGDRHRLDERERIFFHERPVLECPGLGFVRVAHEEVGSGGRRGHGGPLAARGECRAAPAHESRIGHLPDDAGRAEFDRPAERIIPAGRLVVVEAGGVDAADATQEPQALGSVFDLRDPDAAGTQRDGEVRSLPAGEIRQQALDRQSRSEAVDGRVLRVGALDEGGRRPVARPHARARKPRDGVGSAGRTQHFLEDGRDPARSRHPADDVVAGVDDDRRARRGRKQRVEAGDAVRLGGREPEALADEVHAAFADPAHRVDEGVERGQQEVARRWALARGHGYQERVHGFALGRGGLGRHELQVHRALLSRRAPARASRSGPRWP